MARPASHLAGAGAAMHLGTMPYSLDQIEAALALPPLGERSDYDLNPEVKAAQLPGVQQRPAAVLCGLVPRDHGLNVVLTRRTGHLARHAGQIAFPGGRVDAEDADHLAAALREAEEEIGLRPDQVRIIGTLDQYLTSTGFRVTPFVGAIDPHWHAVPDPNEVEEVFEVPLDFLMDPANRHRHAHDRQGVTRYYYAMPWGRYYIWGATAGMLKGLSDRLAALAGEGAG